MFSEMIAALRNGDAPEPVSLQIRFDFAMIKKLGVIKLPPAFWVRDPKINPRSDHLFWAALLLNDRARIDMALSVLAVELAEMPGNGEEKSRNLADERARELVRGLLELMPGRDARESFALKLGRLAPEWLNPIREILYE